MEKTTYILRNPNGNNNIIGQSSLTTVVDSAIEVFANDSKDGQELRALSLSAALNSASEAGANRVDTDAAFNIGKTIGLELRANIGRKTKLRTTLRRSNIED